MNFLKFRWTSLLARLYVQIAVANHENFFTQKNPVGEHGMHICKLPYICYLNFWLKTIFYHHISFSYKAYRASLGWCGKDFPIHEEDTSRGYLWLWIIWGKSFWYWRGNLLDFCFLIGVKSINNDDRTRKYDMI